MSVTYNGITLPFHRTLTHSARNVESPDGGGDVLYTEREFAYEGVLTPDVPGLVLPGETFAGCVRRVEALLRQTRKPLTVRMDSLFLALTAADDVKNGPIPGTVSVVNIAGTQACLVRFSVKCHTPVCDARGVYPQWIAHRWKETLEIDPQTWANKWTRTFSLHIRPGPLTADSFRGVVTPPIRSGYLRTTPPRYELAEDGLSLRGSVTDTEQYAMPPAGVIQADGHCDIAANLGMYQTAEVSVRFAGAITADKYRLLQLATAVASRKLEDMGGQKDQQNRLMINQGALRTKLYKNEVEVYFRARIAAPKGKDVSVLNSAGQVLGNVAGSASGAWSMLNILTAGERKPGDKPKADRTSVPKVFDPPKGLTTKPLYFADRPTDPKTGNAGLVLLAAALQDPCIAPPMYPTVGGLGQLVTDPNATGSTGEPPAERPQESELRAGGVDPTTGAPQDRTITLPTPVVGASRQQQAAGGVPQLVTPETPPGFMWPTPTVSVISRAVFDATEYAAEQPTLSVLYTDYTLRLRVRRSSGKVGYTEQKKGGLTRFVQVSAPAMTLQLDWAGTRAGGKVAAPDVSGWGDNYVVLDEEDDAEGVVEVAEDGVTLLNKRAGTIVIGVTDPSKAVLRASIAPWVAELLGRDPEPLAGPDGPPADTEEFQRWRDAGGSAVTGELRGG